MLYEFQPIFTKGRGTKKELLQQTNSIKILLNKTPSLSKQIGMASLQKHQVKEGKEKAQVPRLKEAESYSRLNPGNPRCLAVFQRNQNTPQRCVPLPPSLRKGPAASPGAPESKCSQCGDAAASGPSQWVP